MTITQDRSAAAWPHQALLVFTATEARTATAMFERLFPADERGPGARDIGVVEYVDRALDGFDQQLTTAYKVLLAAFNDAAGTDGGFAELAPDRQDELIEAFATGTLTSPFGTDEQKALFEQVRAHLREGLFADPIYGGNRDASGWKLLGHPGVWLENSVEENLSTEPVTKGGVVKTLADVLHDLPHDPKEDELKLQAHAAGLSPRFIDEVDVLLVGVGAMGGLVAQTFADARLTVVGLEAGPWRTKDECLPEELGQAYYARGGLGPKFQLETPRWRQRADQEETHAATFDAEGDTHEATFSLGRMVNGVGGSAGHYGAWLRRFHPSHFRPLTRIIDNFGRNALPEGCTLADWPVNTTTWSRTTHGSNTSSVSPATTPTPSSSAASRCRCRRCGASH